MRIKHTVSWTRWILGGWLCLISGGIAFSQEKMLTIAGDEEKRDGYLVQITSEAFKRAGYLPTFEFVPWSRALTKSMDGEYDVLLAAYYTEARAEKFLYSDPIGKAQVYLWQLKKRQITYQQLDDLKPYRIGHISQSKVSDAFDLAEREFLNIDYVFDTQTNIRKLLAGRIDLFVEKKQRVIQLLRNEFSEEQEKITFVEPPLNINFFHNCVSKILPGHQQIIDDFNRGLASIRQDGTEATILRQYGMHD
ncbi:MAG: transporter substrate-binding domain-containing protein [Hahellaceae bacterium]|nr:transporter substrate-binding domain-containing protein [Hahellaceae bacterium]